MSKHDPCECLHCKELFEPERHNRWQQKFCGKAECRIASKTQSQQKWLNKSGNRDLLRLDSIRRVREWRDENPGYWKRRAKPPGTLQDIVSTLQDVVPAQVVEHKDDAKTRSAPSLNHFNPSQDPLILGLISHLIDSPLQDIVEEAARRLLQKGFAILGMRSGMETKGNTYAD